MNVPDDKEGGHDEVNMETLGKDFTFLYTNYVISLISKCYI